MMRWLLLALLAVPAYATELPQRALFFANGQAPVHSSTTAPTPSNTNTVNNYLYVSATQWSFWWRGQRIAADAMPPGITVQQPGPGTLEFTENGQKYTFEVGKFDSSAQSR